MEKAVFLDRDGTINREVNVLRSLAQLRILPGSAKAIREINRMGFLVIVVTNQAVVARGWLTEGGLKEINDVMIERLARKGAHIDAVYYCPHHPDANLKKYRMKCSCRKPGTKMFRDAAKKFGIDLKKSFMIGDNTRDIVAGRRIGAKTILVLTGHAGRDGLHDVKPDFAAKDLRAAARIIKRHAK